MRSVRYNDYWIYKISGKFKITNLVNLHLRLISILQYVTWCMLLEEYNCNNEIGDDRFTKKGENIYGITTSFLMIIMVKLY